jgi:hypothetical protein
MMLEGKLSLAGKRSAILFCEQAQLFHHLFWQAKTHGPLFVPIRAFAGASHRHIVL